MKSAFLLMFAMLAVMASVARSQFSELMHNQIVAVDNGSQSDGEQESPEEDEAPAKTKVTTDQVTDELINEKREMHVKLNQGFYEDAVEDLDSLLERVEPFSKSSTNVDFLGFVIQCRKERIYCLRQLNRYADAIVESKKMIELSYKINDHAKNYSLELTDKVLDELDSKFGSIPAYREYVVLGLSHKAKLADVEKAYKKILLTVHPDKLATLDPKAKSMMDRYFEMVQNAHDVLVAKLKH